MRCAVSLPFSVAILLFPLVTAADGKLEPEQRIEIIRGMTAELATSKVILPRSKKPLLFQSGGTYDKKNWDELGREFGPAARVGDLLKITKVTIGDDRIVLEINGGMKGGRKWYDRVQVGTGRNTSPISSGDYSVGPGGTTLAIVFDKAVPGIQAAELKKLLAPLFNFNFRSATEQYVETLPPEIQKAVKEKTAIQGMEREHVLLALGRPRLKVRETKEGVELEDWIYGEPPGRITFVTFDGGKVVQIKETYAGLGGETAPPLKVPR
jgi:hypothetical protein